MAKKKVQDIKEEQGYTKEAPKCQNCNNYSSDVTYSKSEYRSEDFREEKNMSCDLGGFACKKSTWCPSHSFK